ncbi:MAG: ParB/RepB/Spo0J family partition protein [Candidatus Adiutrix sp.]|jgi:ParB family chromosome partitioning protein|nr:ParB/RepB/Spo0J family partition protein [Candidatus Adiutrix sp.]
MNKPNRLGRGLESLLPEKAKDKTLPSANEADSEDELKKNRPGQPLMVKIDSLTMNPNQPRRHFNEKELISLSQSIKARGIIEPLVAREVGDDKYEIIAGERRLRAAKLANLQEVPVIIRELSNDPSESLILALIENLCREDLNPIEEAESFHKLEKEFGKTHQEIANLSGRERPTVTNSVRLLKLPEFIQDDVRFKRLSAGHARTLLALNDASLLPAIRTEILAKNMTVRQTEALIKKINKKPKAAAAANIEEEAYFEALAKSFTNKLNGLKVKISHSAATKKMEIFYNNNEDLEYLMKKIGVESV